MVFMSNKRIWIKEEYVWYAIGKIWPFRQEIKFSPKKNPKIMNNFSDMLALEGAGGQTGDFWSTSGLRLQTWRYNGSKLEEFRNILQRVDEVKGSTISLQSVQVNLICSCQSNKTKNNFNYSKRNVKIWQHSKEGYSSQRAQYVCHRSKLTSHGDNTQPFLGILCSVFLSIQYWRPVYFAQNRRPASQARSKLTSPGPQCPPLPLLQVERTAHGSWRPV